MTNIRVNDQLTTLDSNTVLRDFLIIWQQATGDDIQPTFAVAVNGEFIPRAQYATLILIDGDKLDIVSPVGGG